MPGSAASQMFEQKFQPFTPPRRPATCTHSQPTGGEKKGTAVVSGDEGDQGEVDEDDESARGAIDGEIV